MNQAMIKVDPEDQHYLHERKWHLHGKGYVSAQIWKGGKSTRVYLHRLILGLSKGDGLEGDHIDGNKLDCRRENLRIVTTAQNAQNRPAHGSYSRFRGVTFIKAKNRWKGSVTVAGRTVARTFRVEDEAAEWARDMRSQLMTHSVER